MLQLADVKMEYKEAAVMSYGVKHQGAYFRACTGLMYWIRYGRYVFDIRHAREYLDLELTQCIDVESDAKSFELKINALLKQIGNKSFLSFCHEVHNWNDHRKEIITQQNGYYWFRITLLRPICNTNVLKHPNLAYHDFNSLYLPF